jgi:DNA phosphorothioation-dependent restriction protein DptG
VFFDAETQDYALHELEEMGMIDRQSDSGGAVYVRTI